MGGRVSINCEKTGYSATIDFLTKVRFSTRGNIQDLKTSFMRHGQTALGFIYRIRRILAVQ